MDKPVISKAAALAEQLAAMAANKEGQPSNQSGRPMPAAQFTGPKTMPGMVFGAQDLLRDAKGRVTELEGKLAKFEGALPVLLIDPAMIKSSRWANRDERSFADEEFLSLKRDIESAGGTVQPIKVRSLTGLSAKIEGGVGPSNPPALLSTKPFVYEIAFGHRRHRACLELGIPVLALLDDTLSDRDLFEEMERENRDRKNLTPWEQGCMYARALDEGLFPSAGKLADAISRDLGDVGKAVALARLPTEVIDAIGNPQALQFRWSKPLKDAVQADPDGVLANARSIIAKGGERDPKVVFEALVDTRGRGGGPSNPLAKKAKETTTDLGLGAKLIYSNTKSFQLELGKRKLDEAQTSRLTEGLKALLLAL